MKLKPVSQQNILITGATSGIGLTTARMAAKRGASLGLIARNEQALNELCEELRSQGCRAVGAAADVGDAGQFRRAAQQIAQELGTIDTWVNNAGVSVYGRIMEVPTEDMRQLFDTNLWGVVNGSKLGVEYLRSNGGALINLGSEVSDAAIPLQGIYTASKHAVKGFTDSLRMELEADKLPISVTLIQPTAIDTPIPREREELSPLRAYSARAALCSRARRGGDPALRRESGADVLCRRHVEDQHGTLSLRPADNGEGPGVRYRFPAKLRKACLARQE